jgi:decaprenylphospho-beta-D-ribofuranose 2-oxidase
LDAFLYPLDALLDWNLIYGRRGLRQFQCVLPEEQARAGMVKLLQAIADSRRASFLAVLKRLGGSGRGHLSFPREGYTLALDFPNRARTAALFERLEAITLEHGGRIYLAKDSLLSAAGFGAMYPELPAFREVLEEVDPEARFQSDLSRRLRIREDAP